MASWLLVAYPRTVPCAHSLRRGISRLFESGPMQRRKALNVRYGSLVHILTSPRHVCFIGGLLAHHTRSDPREAREGVQGRLSIAALADAAGKQMVTTIQPRPFAQDAMIVT